MIPKDLRSWFELSKSIVTFLTILAPVLEKWQTILPVSPHVRKECLVIALVVCFLAVLAGYSTGRYTANGLAIGWCFLLLFLLVLSVQLANLSPMAWAERPIYVLVFAFFSLSTSAFLAYSVRRRATSIETWEENVMR
jgi:L-cystine uptake protein TcyP (sodium:dicarboxylate symporter family)